MGPFANSADLVAGKTLRLTLRSKLRNRRLGRNTEMYVSFSTVLSSLAAGPDLLRVRSAAVQHRVGEFVSVAGTL